MSPVNDVLSFPDTAAGCALDQILSSQAPLSMKISRQEYWSGLPCPPPGDLPYPGIKPMSPASPALRVDSLPLSHWGAGMLTLVTDARREPKFLSSQFSALLFL